MKVVTVVGSKHGSTRSIAEVAGMRSGADGYCSGNYVLRRRDA